MHLEGYCNHFLPFFSKAVGQTPYKLELGGKKMESYYIWF